MKQNKGQASMEFLMTYGWAILSAIVVICVLAIYFKPTNLVNGNNQHNLSETEIRLNQFCQQNNFTNGTIDDNGAKCLNGTNKYFIIIINGKNYFYPSNFGIIK